jgi:hypothetical protein
MISGATEGTQTFMTNKLTGDGQRAPNQTRSVSEGLYQDGPRTRDQRANQPW